MSFKRIEITNVVIIKISNTVSNKVSSISSASAKIKIAIVHITKDMIAKEIAKVELLLFWVIAVIKGGIIKSIQIKTTGARISKPNPALQGPPSFPN